MSKTFGYTNSGTGRGWFNSDAYSDRIIEQIKDPEGGIEITLPTAIPSPFARIDLVRSAFKNITKTSNLTASKANGVANRDNEKLVSEALDLAELLFNYDSIKEHLTIHVWDKEKEIAILKKGSPAHKSLADTLELYFNQDKQTYNFDMVKHLFLIEYKHTIIGCTSPSTLFFSSANDLSKAQIKLTKNYCTFDSKYIPLYEREEDFQIYLYSLFKAAPELSIKLNPISAYLDNNLKILKQSNFELFNKIKALTDQDYFDNYEELDTGRAGQVIEILGITLRKRRKEDIIAAIKNSDFIIHSSKYNGNTPPLVLQNNLTKTYLQYAMDKWNSNIGVPYYESEENLSKRILPGLQLNYPYLTVSDFLEPYIISLPYPIDKNKYFDGNLELTNSEDNTSYLLPLKQLFFEYFNTDDLISSKPRTPEITIKQIDENCVKVTLRIPIIKENEFITFEREYFNKGDQITSVTENKGIIWKHNLGLTIFPLVKSDNEEIPPQYRIQLIDRNLVGELSNSDYHLSFIQSITNQECNIKAQKIRSDKHIEDLSAPTTDYYVLDSNFDYIQISDTVGFKCNGILIPKWTKYQSGSDEYKFAIDFGTTNTHIEYRINNNTPAPFDITPKDLQIAHLFDKHKTASFISTAFIDFKELIDREFIPPHIESKKECDYKFPQRSVIAESPNRNTSVHSYSLADFNIAFGYGKKQLRSKTTANLKWSKKDKLNSERIGAFIDQLVFMLRNKVLLGKGDLKATQFISFYPTSMKPARRSHIEMAWNESIKRYFGMEIPIHLIPEALAPYYYYKDSNRIKTGSNKPVISIDIGGGTSDILILSGNQPQLQTSFRFAGNTLFGDAYSEAGAARSNKLISKYIDTFKNILKENKQKDLGAVLDRIIDSNRSEEINNFLLNLENSPKLSGIKVSYSEILSNNEHLKIVFLYFYTAIIYHVAQICKYKGYPKAKYIIFSGTGSNVLSLITKSNKILNDYSMLIFSEIYDGEKFDSDDFSVVREQDFPKEVTCKGGLLISDNYIDNTPTFVFNSKGDSSSSLTYRELTPEYKTNVIESVKDFNQFFKDLNKKFNFEDYFEVSMESFTMFNTEVNKHLEDYLESGIEMTKRMEEINTDDVQIGETLFFYPIIGTIRELISELATINND